MQSGSANPQAARRVNRRGLLVIEDGKEIMFFFQNENQEDTS